MARPAKGDKQASIRKATVEEVAHVGSTSVSVNKIANRAGVSVGTIYRFHRSKDALLFSVFLDIKHDIHQAMMAAAAGEKGTAARLKAMWFALVDYGFSAPGDFQIVEIMSSESRGQITRNAELETIRAEILGEIEAGIDDGTLVNADVRTIETVLASPAITLARRAALSGEPIDRNEVEGIFALVWRGISREQPTA